MPKYNEITDIVDILNEYSDEVQEELTNEAINISDKIVAELRSVKNTYKIRTGKYNKGWKVNEKKGRGIINCTVWNSTDWRLTHLLEYGHATRNGGKTKAFVHIAPVEKKYVIKYQRDVEKIIKNGG